LTAGETWPRSLSGSFRPRWPAPPL
jgi:hypothetical protein